MGSTRSADPTGTAKATPPGGKLAIAFCVRFSCYTLVMFLLVFLLRDEEIAPFARTIAWLSYRILHGLGMAVTLSGVTVSLPGFAADIKDQCTAIYETGLYVAAVMAFPAPLRQRASGVLVGAALIFALNIVRVLSLIVLGAALPEWFLGAHLYVWQGLVVAGVAGCWLGWASRVRPLA